MGFGAGFAWRKRKAPPWQTQLLVLLRIGWAGWTFPVTLSLPSAVSFPAFSLCALSGSSSVFFYLPSCGGRFLSSSNAPWIGKNINISGSGQKCKSSHRFFFELQTSCKENTIIALNLYRTRYISLQRRNTCRVFWKASQAT